MSLPNQKFFVILLYLTITGIVMDSPYVNNNDSNRHDFPFNIGIYLEFNNTDNSENDNKKNIEEDNEEKSNVLTDVPKFISSSFKNTYALAQIASWCYKSTPEKPPKY